MKIQIFTRNFLGKISNFDVGNLSAIGGAEVYLMQLIEAIHQKYSDAEITVYQLGDDNKEFYTELFTLKHIKLNKIEKIFFPITLSLKFKKIIEKDSLKIFNYPNYAAFVGVQKNSIGIFHGVEWDTDLFSYVFREVKYRYRNIFGVLTALLKYIYFRLVVPTLVKKGINNIDCLVSVDNNIFNYVKKEKHKGKINVIYNCVDLDFFTGNPKIDNTAESTIILVPRNLNVARGVFLLPDIVTRLLKKTDKFVVQVVGTGPLKGYIEKKIQSENIQNHIKLLGHVNDRGKMVELFRSANIVLIPTVFSEGTSLSALEAMACNKPVIMTKIGGLSEIGIDGVDKLSSNANAEEIADKIYSLMCNEELMDELKVNSRKCVENHHNYKDWSNNWLEIINKFYI
ncbi:glycosyltransferase family 4 protein [Paenibacillus sp. FSL R10-2778]|uniref:glycosyltransferase family 4 protein n=1 Tax=unclassified Paenibacillus TaxID=185978 RepID=UPI0031580ACF